MTFLRAAGYSVHAEGDGLHVEPRGNLTPAECDQIRTLKPGLMAILADERWAECRACLAGVDPVLLCEANSHGIGSGCPLPTCPYRKTLSVRRRPATTSAT
jgi:hypothetical protein